jgi:hypothetical protein
LKYSDWSQALSNLKDRAMPLLVDEELLTDRITVKDVAVSNKRASNRGATLEEHTYEIYLGDEIAYRVDGKKSGDYVFRQAYRATEKAWQTLLGSLTTKITMAEQLHQRVLRLAVQPYIKEAVMDRLLGEGDIPDNEVILKNAANKRIGHFNELIKSLDKDSTGGDFRGNVPLPSPSPNYNFVMAFSRWGAAFQYGQTQEMKGMKCCWSFLMNFEELEATVKGFAVHFNQIAAIAEKSAKEV